MTRTQFLAIVAGALTGTVVYYSTGWWPANWEWWLITLPPCIGIVLIARRW